MNYLISLKYMVKFVFASLLLVIMFIGFGCADTPQNSISTSVPRKLDVMTSQPVSKIENVEEPVNNVEEPASNIEETPEAAAVVKKNIKKYSLMNNEYTFELEESWPVLFKNETLVEFKKVDDTGHAIIKMNIITTTKGAKEYLCRNFKICERVQVSGVKGFDDAYMYSIDAGQFGGYSVVIDFGNELAYLSYASANFDNLSADFFDMISTIKHKEE